jgi:hypothetical protein
LLIGVSVCVGVLALGALAVFTGDRFVGMSQRASLVREIPTECVRRALRASDAGELMLVPSQGWTLTRRGFEKEPPSMEVDARVPFAGRLCHVGVSQWRNSERMEVGFFVAPNAPFQKLPRGQWEAAERATRIVAEAVLGACGPAAGWDGGIECSHNGTEKCSLY